MYPIELVNRKFPQVDGIDLKFNYEEGCCKKGCCNFDPLTK